MTLSAVEFWNYFPVVCFWITTVPFVFTCSVSRAGRIEQLVQAAEQQIQDDIILLPMPNLPPINPGIVRTTVGRTAVFSCSAPTQEADTGAPQIVWRHKNITIHTDHTVPASTPFNYTRREDNGNHYLSIHNITPLDPYGVSIITTAKCFFLKHYKLQTRPKADDVFVGRLQNVTTPYSQASLTCSAYVHCTCWNDGPYFIWKFDGKFAMMSVRLGHYLMQFFDSRRYPYGVHKFEGKDSCAKWVEGTPCDSTFTVYMKPDTKRWPTLVECWAQPNQTVNEWYVQKTYVEFV